MSDEWGEFNAWLRKWGKRVAILVLVLMAWMTWFFIQDERAAEARQEWYREMGRDPRVTGCAESLAVHAGDSIAWSVQECLTNAYAVPPDTARRIEAFWNNIMR